MHTSIPVAFSKRFSAHHCASKKTLHISMCGKSIRRKQQSSGSPSAPQMVCKAVPSGSRTLMPRMTAVGAHVLHCNNSYSRQMLKSKCCISAKTHVSGIFNDSWKNCTPPLRPIQRGHNWASDQSCDEHSLRNEAGVHGCGMHQLGVGLASSTNMRFRATLRTSTHGCVWERYQTLLCVTSINEPRCVPHHVVDRLNCSVQPFKKRCYVSTGLRSDLGLDCDSDVCVCERDARLLLIRGLLPRQRCKNAPLSLSLSHTHTTWLNHSMAQHVRVNANAITFPDTPHTVFLCFDRASFYIIPQCVLRTARTIT